MGLGLCVATARGLCGGFEFACAGFMGAPCVLEILKPRPAMEGVREKRGHIAGSCGCSLTAQGHSRAMIVDRMPTTRIGVTWDHLHAPLLRLLPPGSPRDTGSRHGLCGSRPYPRDLSLGPSGPSGRQLEQNFLGFKPADCSLQQNYCLECCLLAWGAHLLGPTASIKACMHSVLSPACATSAKLGP